MFLVSLHSFSEKETHEIMQLASQNLKIVIFVEKCHFQNSKKDVSCEFLAPNSFLRDGSCTKKLDIQKRNNCFYYPTGTSGPPKGASRTMYFYNVLVH